MTAKAKKKSSVTPPRGQSTLAKGTFFDRYGVWIYLFLAFFIPFILIFFAFKVMGVSPFGTNQILEKAGFVIDFALAELFPEGWWRARGRV